MNKLHAPKKPTKVERAALALLETCQGASTASVAFDHQILGFRGIIHDLRKRHGVQLHDEWCISKDGTRFKRTTPATAEDRAKLMDVVAAGQRKRGALQ